MVTTFSLSQECSVELPDEIQKDGPNGNFVACAVRVSTPPVIDGQLNDATWAHAMPINGFTQRVPKEGAPSSEKTEVRILYDDDNLYIGARCFDREADRLWSKGMIRDDLALGDDAVAVLLDPYHDHRGGYIFAISLNGGKTDGQLLGQSRREGYNIDWDGYWWGKSSWDETGWSAEFAIPFKTLRYKPQHYAVWSMIIRRHINRKNEETYWPSLDLSSTIYRPADAGHLVGLESVDPGVNVEVKPYVLAGIRHDGQQQLNGVDGTFDVGIDMRYGITSGLNLLMSLNTDFAQVEVDEEQINLTRNKLFFPEKRDFFLDGAREFDFGVAREAQVFFSRRIGLSDGGEPIPLVYGLKLTGKIGSYSIGALNTRTQKTEEDPADTSSVLRLRRDIFTNSKIGLILTDRHSTSLGDFNRVVGVDADFLFHRYLQFRSFLAKSHTPARHKDDVSSYVSGGWENDRWLLRVSRLNLPENFNPELGFVAREGIKSHFGEFRFSPRPAVNPLRQVAALSTFRYVQNQQSRLETREWWTGFRVDLDSGDSFTVGVTQALEALDKPLRLTREVSVPPGVYGTREWKIIVSPYLARKWRPALTFAWGGFYNGTRKSLAFDGSYRLNGNWGFALGGILDFLDLPGRSVSTAVLTTRIEYSFSPDLYIRSLMQWNSDTRQRSMNVRLNFIHNPGSDLFVVYNETVDKSGLQSEIRDRSLVVKFDYLLRF